MDHCIEVPLSRQKINFGTLIGKRGKNIKNFQSGLPDGVFMISAFGGKGFNFTGKSLREVEAAARNFREYADNHRIRRKIRKTRKTRKTRKGGGGGGGGGDAKCRIVVRPAKKPYVGDSKMAAFRGLLSDSDDEPEPKPRFKSKRKIRHRSKKAATVSNPETYKAPIIHMAGSKYDKFTALLRSHQNPDLSGNFGVIAAADIPVPASGGAWSSDRAVAVAARQADSRDGHRRRMDMDQFKSKVQFGAIIDKLDLSAVCQVSVSTEEDLTVVVEPVAENPEEELSEDDFDWNVQGSWANSMGC